MRWSSFVGASLALVILAASAPRADAAAISTNYTVTDLGPITGPQDYLAYLPSNMVDSQVVYSTDGRTAYAFPRSTVPAPQSLLASIPPAVSASKWDFVDGGMYAYSYNGQQGFLSATGLVVGINFNGSSGAGNNAESAAFAVQRNADGSFGPAQVLYTSRESGIIQGSSTYVYDINKLGVILGASSMGENGVSGDFSLPIIFDTKTGSSVAWTSQLAGWNLEWPTAIDDQGRILVSSYAPYGQTPHELLLTPDGVSSDPIATPEPSTLAILGVGAAGVWWRRRWARRAT